jgi:RHS repeat-associated protein
LLNALSGPRRRLLRRTAVTAVLALAIGTTGAGFPVPASADDVPAPTSLSLAAASSTFSADGAMSFTATTDTTMTGTGLYVSVWDLTAGVRLSVCSTGTSCAATGYFASGGPHQYRAFLTADVPSVVPGAPVLQSNTVEGARSPWTLALTSSAQTFPAGGHATLTATANQSVTGTGGVYAITIMDATTQGMVVRCTTGSSCSGNVSFPTGGAHSYVAYVSSATTWWDDIQVESNTTVVSRAAWTLALTTDTTSFAAGGTATLTATANQDVAETSGHFAITIMDGTTQATIVRCTTGTVCSATVSFPTGGPHNYVAYVSSAGSWWDDIQVESNQFLLTRAAWTLTLTQDAQVFPVGGHVAVTATANQDVGLTSGAYAISIIDINTQAVVGRCTDGTSCTANVSFPSGGPHRYVAYVSSSSGWWDAIQAESNEVSAERMTWALRLKQDRTMFRVGDHAVLTAVANQDVGLTGGTKAIFIVDINTQGVVARCTTGTSCAANVSFASGIPHRYVAYVSDQSAFWTDVQVQSNELSVRRAPWTVALKVLSDGSLLGTANQNVGSTSGAYGISLLEKGGSFRVVGQCTTGTTCASTVDPSTLDMTKGYVAYVSYPGAWWTDIVADSDGFSADTGRDSSHPNETTGGSNPAASNPQCACADPVNTATGVFYEPLTDLVVPGRAGAALSRTYSSDVADQTGPFGHGWNAGFGPKILAGDDTDPVKVVQENGSQTWFYPSSTGVFTTDQNVRASLARDTTTGAWTFVRANEETFRFTSAGQLASVEDRNGETVTYTYTGGKVTRIADGTRGIDLTYDTGGRVTSATTTDGRTVAYAYDTAGDLIEVTDPRGHTWTYTYDSAHRLISQAKPNGATTTNEYDTAGKVVKQTDPLGGETTLSYTDSTDGGRTSRITRVTNPDGETSDYWYSLGWLVKKVADPAGPAPVTTAYVNDGGGNAIQVTDPLGRISYATYDDDGNRLSATDPTGRTSRWTYNPDRTVATSTTPGGATTSYTYDSHGNLTGTTVPLTATTNAVTSFGHADTSHPGDVTSTTDPRGKTTLFEYDTAGNRTCTTTPEGRTTTVAYDAAGNPTSTVAPRGNQTGGSPSAHRTEYEHDLGGLLTETTSPLGQQTAFAYDTVGQLTTITDPADRVTTREYDLNGNLTKVTEPGNRITRTWYDPANRPTKTTRPDATTTTWTYDRLGRLATTTGPDGNTTGATTAQKTAATVTTTYDLAGKPVTTSVPDPNGGVIEAAVGYDAAGRATSQTDPLGKTTTTTYNTDGLPATVTDALSHTVAFGYDKAGRPVSVTDPRDGTSTTEYDLAGNRTATTTAADRTTRYAYDDDGLLTSTVDPNGTVTGAVPADHTSAVTYDANGQPTVVTDPLGRTSTTVYDAAGRVTSTTDAKNHTTGYTYDALGRTTSVTAPDGGVTGYTYNTAGDLVTKTAPNGKTTTYTYDTAGRPTGITDPLGNTRTVEYDDTGRVARTVSATGNATTTAGDGTTENTYDTLGRLTAVDYPAPTPDLAFAYDKASRRTSMTDGTGTATYTYDDTGRLTGLARGTTAFAYAYDPTGNITGRTYPNGTHVTTAYDPDGLPTSVTSGSRTTGFAYDPVGQLAEITEASGAKQTYETDAAGQVTRLTHTLPDDTVLARRDYAYDQAGNPTALTVLRGTSTSNRSWAYDAADRLTAECDTAAPCSPTGSAYGWTYDTNGRRIAAHTPAGTTTYAYDDADRLVSSVLGSVTTDYDYDADGQQTAAGDRTYAYDATGHMTSATVNGVATAYAYDGDGNRVAQTIGGQTGTLTWDPNNPLPTLVAETPATATARIHVNGPDGTPLSFTAAGDRYEYLTDPLGSVTDLLDDAGDRAVSYDYDAFGGPRAPPVPDATGAPDNPLRWAGQYADPTGLYDMRARQYDPTVGQFTAPDPLGGNADRNPQTVYGYAGSNPLLYTDPSGLCFGPAFVCKAASRVKQELQYQIAPGLGDYVESAKAITFEQASNTYGGYLNGLTMGGYQAALERTGLGNAFDRCSAEYRTGSATGTGASLLVAAGGTAKAVRAVRAAKASRAAETEARLVNAVRGTHNCASCAIAGDSTLAGSPASATNLFPGQAIPDGMALIEEYAGASWREVAGASEIEAELLAAGNGARGIVYGGKDGAAHVWNAVVQKGKVDFIDFQGIGPSGRAAFEPWTRFLFVRTT